MKNLKKEIRRLKKTFDSKRQKWVELTKVQKQQTVESTRKKIDSFIKQQTNMSSQFKQWRKTQQKAAKRAEKLKKKKLRKKQKKKAKKNKVSKSER
jgi:hypothetical protein